MSSFHSAAVKNVASTGRPLGVADDVVVEAPLVLGPLARPANARSRNCRPSTVNVPRSPSSASHSAASSASAERWCSSVSAGADADDLRVAPLGGLAAALQRRRDVLGQRARPARGRRPACGAASASTRTPVCFIGTAGNVPKFV